MLKPNVFVDELPVVFVPRCSGCGVSQGERHKSDCAANAVWYFDGGFCILPRGQRPPFRAWQR